MGSSDSRRVLVASLNPGKAEELCELARTWGWSPVTAAELALNAPDEVGATFEANAIDKARLAAAATGELAIADDSGLVLPALGRGEPGVHTRRWADAAGSYDAAVKTALRGSHALEARYVCALALARPDGSSLCERGELVGELMHPGRGQGPGAWPFFLLPNGRTFAESSQVERLAAHPRGVAAALIQPQLAGWLS